MTDLPPRFTADLEASLDVPPSLASSSLAPSSDQQSTSSRSRRWDDPPEDEPLGPPENLTTMVFIKSVEVRSHIEAEIMQLTFTASDSHLAALVPKSINTRCVTPDGPFGLSAWHAGTGQRLASASTMLSSHGLRVRGGFALKPGVADFIVACPSLIPAGNSSSSYTESYGALLPRLEVYDLGRKERLLKQDVAIRAPVAWSPDGEVLVGVSSRDASRMVVLGMPKNKDGYIRTGSTIMCHSDEVTKLAFLPLWESGGRALVSAGKDGYLRVTDVETRRTLQRVEIGARAPASIMQVSKDGKLVVTVWGRDVVLWFLETGRVHNYNLNAVRVNEGWPLSVSPDCRYLACRNEEGFDVMDVQTGKFRGEFAWTGETITAAAFNSEGTRLAIGDHAGMLQLFEIITS
ncbi:WD40-repeat-containing domain protein [Chaetomium tenue]|uniref:WD40-repeat-containing domain protein n=1 Tax=Chaetomium tenue TaxID=1854479 RepID=A0ACB7P3V6_9PEZI|nr:WD40-repeat-containing domain protein [Chaetomium globosum]